MSLPPFLRFPVSGAIASFLRALTAGAAADELGVPTDDELNAAIGTRLPRLATGRTLYANTMVALGDYGTYVALNGYQLTGSAVSAGNIIGAQGPGNLVTVNQGTISIAAGETALLTGESNGQLRLLSIARLRGCLRTAGASLPSSGMLLGDEHFLTTDGYSYVYTASNTWVKQPESTALNGYVFANGSSFSGATAAASAATPSTLVIRGAQGQAQFAASSDHAVSGTLTSASNQTNLAGVYGATNAPGAFGVFGIHTGNGWGIYGQGLNGLGGVFGRTTSGTGLKGESSTGIGGWFFTGALGTYHALFGTDSGNDRLAVKRDRGSLVWFYTHLGTPYTGELRPPNLTGNRSWSLPDEGGTLALYSQIEAAAELLVPKTTTVNGKALSGNITLDYTDVGAQEPLTSGENIKTINGQSLLGSGDLELAAAYHSHLSVDITDATNAATPNTVSKRGSYGECSFAEIRVPSLTPENPHALFGSYNYFGSDVNIATDSSDVPAILLKTNGLIQAESLNLYTPLSVDHGGTGATTASAARTNLAVPGSVATGITGASAVSNIVAIGYSDYANLVTKDPTTIYLVIY